ACVPHNQSQLGSPCPLVCAASCLCQIGRVDQIGVAMHIYFMLISVIVPTHNRAHTLPRALNSVLQQSHTQLEVVVVDDGSTDRTADLKEVYLRDPRVKWLEVPRGGVSAARNLGVQLSTGECLAFLDSDDEWLRE